MIDSNGIFTIDDKNTETTADLFSQIGGLVGVGARRDGNIYLSDICIGEGINKWAKNKSIRSVKTLNITEEDRAQQFYGFDIMEVFCNNCEDTLNVATNNGANYPYLKPRGSAVSPIEWFRLRDFDGYNPRAEIPYKYTIQNNPSSPEQWVDVYLNPNGELFLSEITPGEITQDIKNYKIALVYRLRGTSVLDGIITDYTIADVEAGEQPIIRYTLSQAGTYDMVLAITNAAYLDQEDTEWLYLPEAVFTASYDPSVTSFKIVYNEDNALVGVNSMGTPVINSDIEVEGIHLDIRIDGGDEALEGNLILDFSSEYPGTGMWEEEIQYKKDFILEPNDSVRIYESRLPYYFSEPYIDKIYIKARLEYRPKWSIENYSVRHIDLLATGGSEGLTLSNEEFAPVTLLDILDSTGW